MVDTSSVWLSPLHSRCFSSWKGRSGGWVLMIALENCRFLLFIIQNCLQLEQPQFKKISSNRLLQFDVRKFCRHKLTTKISYSCIRASYSWSLYKSKRACRSFVVAQKFELARAFCIYYATSQDPEQPLARLLLIVTCQELLYQTPFSCVTPSRPYHQLRFSSVCPHGYCLV